MYMSAGRSIQCSGIKVTPLRSRGERSRSRKDFVLNVSSSRALITTCSLKTPPSYGKSKRINPRDLFTFSYRFSTDIPMSETPGVGCVIDICSLQAFGISLYPFR